MRVKPGKIMIPPKAKRLADNLLVGKPSGQAIKQAGYKVGRQRQLKRVMETKGVQHYLKRINQELELENAKFEKDPTKKHKYIEVRSGESILPRLVIKTYAEGLNATKLYGKNAIAHPDYKTRLLFADRLAEFFVWRKPDEGAPAPANYNQFNFFSAPQQDREKFGAEFKRFLELFYKRKDQG